MRLGAVATRVIMPLIKAAIESGIISRPAGRRARCAIRSTMGMKIATTPVEEMKEPKAPALAISRKISRASLAPARAVSQSPSRWVTPVRTSASPMMKSAAISTTFGSERPSSTSDIEIVPVSGRATIMITATTSMRGRLRTKRKTATPRRASTRARSDIR